MPGMNRKQNFQANIKLQCLLCAKATGPGHCPTYMPRQLCQIMCVMIVYTVCVLCSLCSSGFFQIILQFKYEHKHAQLSKVSGSLPLIMLLHSILRVEIQLSGKMGTKVGLISCQNFSTSSI